MNSPDLATLLNRRRAGKYTTWASWMVTSWLMRRCKANGHNPTLPQFKTGWLALAAEWLPARALREAKRRMRR